MQKNGRPVFENYCASKFRPDCHTLCLLCSHCSASSQFFIGTNKAMPCCQIESDFRFIMVQHTVNKHIVAHIGYIYYDIAIASVGWPLPWWRAVSAIWMDDRLLDPAVVYTGSQWYSTGDRDDFITATGLIFCTVHYIISMGFSGANVSHIPARYNVLCNV